MTRTPYRRKKIGPNLFQTPTGNYVVRVGKRTENVGPDYDLAIKRRDELRSGLAYQRFPSTSPTAPKELLMPDGLQSAKAHLQATLTGLEEQAKRIRTALAALEGDTEEDASARFRQPGALADRTTPELRSAFERPLGGSGGLRVEARRPNGHPRRRRNLTDEEQTTIKSILRRELKVDEPVRRGDLHTLVILGMKRAGMEADHINADHISRQLKALEDLGVARRDVPNGNTAHTIWSKVPVEEVKVND